MKTPLNAGTVLLLALLQGPGYGLDLIERVRTRSGGHMRLRQGSVYPTLRDLERRKLVRSWTVNVPGTGRPRTYYEPTAGGIAVARAQREAIAGFAVSEACPAVPSREILAMRERLERCFKASDFAMMLRRAGKAVGL